MFRKSITHLLLSALFLSFIGAPTVTAKTKEEKAAELAAKVKREITKLGTGPDAHIEVKLRDKTKLKGYVSQIGDNSFAIMNAETGTETNVSYPTVTQAKGKNMSTGAKVAIGVAIGVGLTFLVLWLLYVTVGD